MSRLVKERKYLKRHTNNGIEVRRRLEQINKKVEAQKKTEGSLKYGIRQQFSKRQLTVNYGRLYE